jgi:SlyX protein
MTHSDLPGDAVERIEMKIAFLERANTELSDVVYRQQREIDALEAKLTELSGNVAALKDQQPTEYSQEEERPPHY